MLFLSEQKFLLISPKKMRPVAKMTKKLSPVKALETLPFVGTKAADVLKKVVASAMANAKAKGASEDTLIFKEIQIGEGPRLKRGMAGAHGRWKPIKKRMSHIRVVLETKAEVTSKKEEPKEEIKAEEPKKEEGKKK
jgi:large subunit ribosomal protein L22